ncbi:MAG: NERD domain-containing protein [Rhodospirillaceae bacterium]|nr:NERD domain-containing protein [Rhodospirillaceae bacterium]
MTFGFVAATFGLLLFAVGAVVSRYTPELRGWIGERRVRQIIKDAGFPSLHDVYASDGEGIPTQIDHLIKLPDGIAVVETKNFSGSIYGRSHDKTWTSVMGPYRRKFQNPLRQNYRHIATLRALYPDATFIELVCFVGGRFPRGLPDYRVTTGRLLSMALNSLGRLDPNVERNATDDAWSSLVLLAAHQGRAERIAHRASLRARFQQSAGPG